jgi:hypothetical protein
MKPKKQDGYKNCLICKFQWSICKNKPRNASEQATFVCKNWKPVEQGEVVLD